MSALVFGQEVCKNKCGIVCVFFCVAKMYQQFHNGGLIRVQNSRPWRMKVVPSSKFTIIYLHILRKLESWRGHKVHQATCFLTSPTQRKVFTDFTLFEVAFSIHNPNYLVDLQFLRYLYGNLLSLLPTHFQTMPCIVATFSHCIW